MGTADIAGEDVEIAGGEPFADPSRCDLGFGVGVPGAAHFEEPQFNAFEGLDFGEQFGGVGEGAAQVEGEFAACASRNRKVGIESK